MELGEGGLGAQRLVYISLYYLSLSRSERATRERQIHVVMGPNTMELPLIFFLGGSGGGPPRNTARWARRAAAVDQTNFNVELFCWMLDAGYTKIVWLTWSLSY